MSRLRFALASLVLASCMGARTPAEPPPPVPNILFCMADDWSFGHAGAYGTPWVRTPGFDRVAREGILFTHAYTNNAKCCPARSILLTGRHSWQLKAAANHVCFFPPEFKGYCEALAENGWTVGTTGKGWGPGIAKGRQLTGKPFKARRMKPPTRGISATDYAANFTDFLDAAPAGKPWCFWFGSTEPHRGYQAGSGVAAGKKTTDIRRVPAYWPDTEVVRSDLLDYAVEVESYDAHVVRILDELEKRGLLDNTLVVVTSDHGIPSPRVKGQCYDASNRVPMAIMWRKGIRNPGRTVDDYVSFIDMAPTYLDLAGLTADGAGMQPMTGRSLVEIFTSEKAGRVIPERDHVLVGKERHDIGRPKDWGYPIRGIHREGFLYLRNFEPDRWPGGNPETGYLNCDGSPTKTQILQMRRDGKPRYWNLCFGRRPAEELYDLSKDPDCVKNLAGNPDLAPIKARLGKQLVAELKAQGDPRMEGKGNVFDEYPYAHEGGRNFHARFMAGEKVRAGWVNGTDFEKEPIE